MFHQNKQDRLGAKLGETSMEQGVQHETRLPEQRSLPRAMLAKTLANVE